MSNKYVIAGDIFAIAFFYKVNFLRISRFRIKTHTDYIIQYIRRKKENRTKPHRAKLCGIF